jgi:hypothetical protein
VVAEILGLETFDLLVLPGFEAGPFLMDDVGEDGELVAGLDVVVGPVVGELVAGLLAVHALGDPLVGAALLLPGFAGAVEGEGWVGELLDAFLPNLGQPTLKRLRFRRWNRLNQTQDSGNVPALKFLFATGCFKGEGKGGDRLSPPLNASLRKGSRRRSFLR